MSRRTALLGTFVLSALTMALYRFPFWIVEEFGDISLEQAWFHLTLSGTQTWATVPTALVRGTVRELVLKPTAWGLAVTLLAGLLGHRGAGRRRLVELLVGASAVVLGGMGLMRTAQALNLQDHWTRQSDGPDWMETYHVPPKIEYLAQQTGHPPHNLVLIYVESLQNKFVQPQRPLARWREKHTSASRFFTLPGTQWTLGGIVASQCGLPLMPTGWTGRNNFDEMQAPLRGAVCLGDVLRAAGYKTAFVGGADPDFAGKRQFLQTHGFESVYGREDIRKSTDTYQWPTDWWGVEDHTMLAYAKQVLGDLSRGPQPFFLSLLTLDTHGPDGLMSRHCPAPDTRQPLLGIFDCSLTAVEDFLAELHRQGHMQNTVVIVMGDHPLMAPGWKSPHRQDVDHAANDVFFAMAVPDQGTRKLAAIAHFDVYALSLQATLRTRDQALALGRTPPQRPSLVESEGLDRLAARLRSPSPGYQRLWQVPPAPP